MTTARPKFSALFSRVLARHRKQQGLSQEALAERANVDRTYVGLLERYQRAAGLDVAKRLADGLGIPLTSLIAESEAEWAAASNVKPPRHTGQVLVAEGEGRWRKGTGVARRRKPK